MTPRRLLLILLPLLCLAASAQQDTLVTVLHEVSVVGIKQTAESELAAATIVGAKQAERLNVLTMKGVSEIVPNFYIPDYGSRMTSSIYVRGLGARIDQPVVGLNIDGVSYLNKDNYDFDLFDIQKIEVLRGAQSILNGRNTMAGQVNITTLSPWQYQGLRIMAEYGRANSFKGGIGYYAKLSKKVATGLNIYVTGTDGFFTNAYTGKKTDGERQGSARWKLSVRPSSRLTLTNVLSGQLSRQGGYAYRNIATGEISHDDTCYYWRNSIADALTVGWTGKRVTVTSQTSLQYINDNMTLDQDFLPRPYFTLTQRRREYAFTEDLYAKGHRGSLSWLGGVFLFYKNMDMSAPVTFKDDGITNLIEKYPNQMNPSYPIAWDQRTFVLGSDFIGITSGQAAYAQVTYNLDRWHFEGGLRLDLEQASLKYHSHCDASYTTYHVLPDGQREVYSQNPVNMREHGKLNQDYCELLPKLAVGFDISPAISVYANAAKGYKAGGFNTQMFSDVLQQKVMELMGVTMKYDIDKIVTYKPEESWNYELGVKGTAWRTLDFTATLFYISCINQQLTVFPDGLTTGRIMTNAGRTRSFGAELTATYHTASWLTLNASYGYTNAKFVEYNDGKIDHAGHRLPYAPSNTAFVSATFTPGFSLLHAQPELCLSARGIGDIYWNDANTERQPFYMTCAASLALSSTHWSVRVWGENITNTRYNTFYFMSMGNAFLQPGRPVTYGVTLRVNI